MAFSVVLIQPLTTHTQTTLTMSSTNTDDRSKNYLSLIASTSGPRSSHFGIYQQTSVGSKEVTIRTLVPAVIFAEPYRKALIAKMFFRQILFLADAPSVSFSDLMTTVALYSSINTGSSEREAEAAVTSIRSVFFRVTKLQEVGFADTSGKSIKLLDPTQRPADLAYFTFRSVVSAIVIDKRAPDKILSLEFLLRLPQSFQSTASTPTPPGTPTTIPSPATKTPPSVNSRGTMLNSFTDESLAQLGETELRVLLLDARFTISLPIVSVLSTGVSPSNLFPTFTHISVSVGISSSTPKMNRVR